MQKRNLIISAIACVATLGAVLYAANAQGVTFGAPATTTYQKSLIPITDSTYELGTSTLAWLRLTSDEVCLNGSCRTTWPSGSGSGNVATSTNETAGNLAYWTTTSGTPAKLGKVATTSVTCAGSVSCSSFDALAASPITITGAAGGSFPFSADTNYNQVVYSTSTPTLWLKSGLFASSTSQILYASTTAISANNVYGALTGNADTATALATNASNCSVGSAPLGVDASGAAESCFDVWTEAENTSAAYLSSVNLTTNVTGILPVANGGTGWANLQANTILLGNGTSKIATTTAGTNGQVLALVGGVPTWAATTTFSSGLTYSGGNVTADLGTSITVGELASADFGDWTCNGSACTVDADSIALATDTTGNYVATLADSGASTLTISGSGSENAAVTAGINLANANTWTGKQNLYGTASSTLFSANRAYFGATATSTFGTDGALTLASALTVANGGTGQSTLSSGQVLYGAGTNGIGSVATGTISAGTGISLSATFYGLLNAASIAIDTAANLVWTGAHDFGAAVLEIPNGTGPTVDATGELAWDTTSGQMKIYDGSETRVLSNGYSYPAFSYSTTTWSGTTTIPLGSAFVAETWSGVQCFTDAGTLNVSFYDGTNRMNMLNASTTVGTFGLSTNNTFTAAEKRYVDIGTPASSPTKIACTVKKSITAD